MLLLLARLQHGSIVAIRHPVFARLIAMRVPDLDLLCRDRSLIAGLAVFCMAARRVLRRQPVRDRCQAGAAQLEAVSRTAGEQTRDQVHDRRCLVDDMWSLQGELSARGRDASKVFQARDWPSSRSRSTTRPTRPPSPRPRSSSKRRRPSFTNVLLDENFGEGFEKLNISAIPAVFVFGPDGKEVKRFTMDDPNNQFTYDEVEKAIVALLDAKP